jgi:hypothetical protein
LGKKRRQTTIARVFLSDYIGPCARVMRRECTSRLPAWVQVGISRTIVPVSDEYSVGFSASGSVFLNLQCNSPSKNTECHFYRAFALKVCVCPLHTHASSIHGRCCIQERTGSMFCMCNRSFGRLVHKRRMCILDAPRSTRFGVGFDHSGHWERLFH